MHYFYLLLAIIGEVIATSSLKATNEFTRLWPTLIVIVGYLFSFYFMTLAIRVIPVGITYAVWSGTGIVIISVASYFLYQQRLDLPAVIGISLIVLGVIVINLFSESAPH